MSIFDRLGEQYQEIDDLYVGIELEARSKGWHKKECLYQQKRVLNDQAYFLFMFSRLEDRIREQSSKLIDKKRKTIRSWKQRAAWDILPTSPRADYPFKKRLALLVEQGSSDYNLIADYYQERNSIAHGGSFTKPIVMPTVIYELKRLYQLIK